MPYTGGTFVQKVLETLERMARRLLLRLDAQLAEERTFPNLRF